MTVLRTRRVLDILRAALEVSDSQRAAYLDTACNGDAALRAEVELLLQNDAAEWPEIDLLGRSGDLIEVLTRDEEPLAPESAVSGGRYRIVEKLSEGGMGVVYHAVQDHPRRDVALKVMRGGASGLLRRFQREIRILARLRHPGIAQIHDAGSVPTPGGNRPYLAMELVNGEPIVTYARRRRLDVAAKLELMARVCDAVQFAHQSGVIHRDLKPDNILVEDSSDGPSPKILDFGVASLVDSSAVSLATEPGTVIGTIAYVSPEQIAGGGGTQSDVYSLGVVLYELLSGALPIDVRTDPLATALRRIQDEQPTPISRRERCLGGDVETILHRALDKDPARRYASADALATDVRRFLRHEPILAKPASATYTLGRFVRRHRLLVAVSTAAVLAVLAALVVTSFSYLRARSAEQSALELARVMTEQTLPLLTDRTGTTAERAALAGEVHSAVLALLRQSPHDPTVLSVYADSLRHLARLENDAGRLEKALRLRTEALAAREKAIARAGERDPRLESARAIDLILIGDVFKGRSENATAEGWYLRAADQQRRLVEQDPSISHIEHLAWSEQRLAHLARIQGRPDETARRADRFMELIQRVVSARPDDLTALDGLREAHTLMATVGFESGDPEDAARALERAIVIGRKLFAAEPDNRIYLRGLISNMIHLLSAVGIEEPERAEALAAQALPIAERFYAADPSDVTGVCRLASLLIRSAAPLAQIGDVEAARGRIERGLSLLDSASDSWSTEHTELAATLRSRAAEIEQMIATLGHFEDAETGSE